MTLQIATPPQGVRLKIPVIRTRNPPLPMTHIRVTIKKAATALLTTGKTIETTVADIDLSSIN